LEALICAASRMGAASSPLRQLHHCFLDTERTIVVLSNHSGVSGPRIRARKSSSAIEAEDD
jgi:hypothetical protein